MAERPETRSGLVPSADDREFLKGFSDSVRALVDRFGTDPVTVWQIAEALFRDHPYGGEQLPPLADRPGRAYTIGGWLRLCAGLFDTRAIAASKPQVIDGRLLLLALARVEREFDDELRRSRVRRRLELGLGFASSDVFLPWAQPGRLVEFAESDVLRGHTDSVGYRGAFSPDGRLLATGGLDGTVRLWDVAAGAPRGQPLAGHAGIVRWGAFSPDGRLLATGGDDGTVRLWDVAAAAPSGQPLAGHTAGVGWGAFSPDGSLLATRADEMVRLWDVAAAAPRGQMLAGHTDATPWGAFSPDGRLLATGAEDGPVRLWDVAAAAPRGQPLAGHTGAVPTGAFSPDGRLLATGGYDGTVRLWDVAAAAPRGQPLAGHTPPVWWVAFSPDGSLLATGGPDRTVRLWDVAAAAPRGQPLAGHTNAVGWGAFSPDGRLLATGGSEGTVRLWEATDASLTLAAVVPDAVQGEDLLDLSADVDALANVIVAKSTTPPLSIGMFGDWGAGKSFLIELVQERVRVYARQARRARKAESASHCAHVRNVEFNAWHYADANLWASLVSHVLDELARPEPDSAVSERAAQAQLARLEEELAARSKLRERLERARAHADRVEARKRLLQWTWGLGLGGETTKTLGEVRQDAHTVGGWLRLLLPTGRARIAVIGCAVAVGIALGIVLGVAGVDRVLRLAAGALAGLGAFAAWIGVGAAHVSRLLERAGDTTTVADIHRDDVDAELEAARTRERELRDELADLASGRRLARFAAERGASEDYRAHLGLVSRIHDDFVRMSEILALQSTQVASEVTQPSEQPRPEPRTPLVRLAARLGLKVRRATVDDEQAGEVELPLIDRIVLYIDDLDRCPPSRVVQVLEAVHLILALPLFVVVVAVDPRWLLQSLRLHYSELLAGALPEPEPPTVQRAPDSWEQPQDGGGTGTEAAWESTPLNYLEKIIQIPFTLRPMGRKGVESLVTKLLPVKTDGGPEGVPDGKAGLATVQPTELAHTDAESDASPDRGQPRSAAASTASLAPALSPPTLELTNEEREFAITAGCILRTPRSVKKFTNLYRLVRARLTEESTELDTFLDAESGDIPEYQAVIILLAVIVAFPDEASTFFLGIGDLHARAAEDRRPWRDYIDGLRERRGGRWQELVGFVEDVTAQAICGATSTRDPFRRWALEISRYSFATGQEVFSQYQTRHQPAPSRPPRPSDRAVNRRSSEPTV